MTVLQKETEKYSLVPFHIEKSTCCVSKIIEELSSHFRGSENTLRAILNCREEAFRDTYRVHSTLKYRV